MEQPRFRPVFTFSLFVMAHFGHHVITAVTAPMLPMIRSSFGLSYTQAGFLLSAYTVSYGVAHLVSGWLSGRVGPRLLILVGIVGVGAAGLLAGVAGSFAVLVTAQLFMGVAGSGYHPAAIYFISRITTPARRGRALGIHIIGGSASLFVSPLLAAAIAAAWGWRGSFITLAIPTILLGVFLNVFLGRVSRQHDSQKGATADPPRTGKSVRWTPIIAFLALTTLGGTLAASLIGFIPLYLVDTFGVRAETAARMLAIIYSAGIWAAPLAGWLSDHMGRLSLMIIVSFIAGPAIVLMNFILPGFCFYILLLLIGVYLFVRMPLSEAYLYGEVPSHLRSTLLGVYFFSSSLGGGAFILLIGRIVDQYGFQRVFWISGVSLFVITVLCSAVIITSGMTSRRRRYPAERDVKKL